MRKPTGLVFHEAFLRHRAPYEHPENPQRLVAIRARLEKEDLWRSCEPVPARRATDEELGAIHEASYVAAVDRTADEAFAQLDPDTYVCRDSAEAARLAAGGSVDLALRVLSGDLANGFALLRPPGHHAEANRAMGFCLFNNVAVAAAAARRDGARRVLIVDWDLHHGNGTQDAFWNDPSVLYFSAHQWPLYPGTGDTGETGGPRAPGHTINVPLPAGCGDSDYLAAFDRLLLPVARTFAADLVLVSCGFDAARGDPLGSMQLSPAGYAALAGRLCGLADGKVVLALEGGYNYEAIGRSAAACLRVLLDHDPPQASAGEPSLGGRHALDRAIEAHRASWGEALDERE